jgi:hypothetical protein
MELHEVHLCFQIYFWQLKTQVNIMSPYLAYVLGIITILIPLLIFYVLSLNFTTVSDAWQTSFCDTSF